MLILLLLVPLKFQFVSEAIGDRGNRHTTKTSQINKFKEKNPLLLN